MIKKNAYAKINLSLEILDKRPDGYHNIRSVMQKISLCDILSFDFNSCGNISVTCDKNVCAMEENLAYKAAVLFRELYSAKTDSDCGVSVHIQKKIPDRAGLAGGSADCACVLDAMYEQFGAVSHEDVQNIASSLGSDINFCLDKYRCAVCSDRGIVVDPCRPLEWNNVLVCVPDTGMKTGEIYSLFDRKPVIYDENPTEMIRTLLEQGEYDKIFPHIKNSFSEICECGCKDITEIKNVMINNGACAAQMSGSGSSVFGLFPDEHTLKLAKEKLSSKFSKVFACKTINAE